MSHPHAVSARFSDTETQRCDCHPEAVPWVAVSQFRLLAVQSSTGSVQNLSVTLSEHLGQAEMEMLRLTDLWL